MPLSIGKIVFNPYSNRSWDQGLQTVVSPMEFQALQRLHPKLAAEQGQQGWNQNAEVILERPQVETLLQARYRLAKEKAAELTESIFSTPLKSKIISSIGAGLGYFSGVLLTRQSFSYRSIAGAIIGLAVGKIVNHFAVLEPLNRQMEELARNIRAGLPKTMPAAYRTFTGPWTQAQK